MYLSICLSTVSALKMENRRFASSDPHWHYTLGELTSSLTYECVVAQLHWQRHWPPFLWKQLVCSLPVRLLFWWIIGHDMCCRKSSENSKMLAYFRSSCLTCLLWYLGVMWCSDVLHSVWHFFCHAMYSDKLSDMYAGNFISHVFYCILTCLSYILRCFCNGPDAMYSILMGHVVWPFHLTSRRALTMSCSIHGDMCFDMIWGSSEVLTFASLARVMFIFEMSERWHHILTSWEGLVLVLDDVLGRGSRSGAWQCADVFACRLGVQHTTTA